MGVHERESSFNSMNVSVQAVLPSQDGNAVLNDTSGVILILAYVIE